MSAPINNKENSQENYKDPLLYAPPWARAQGARQDPRLTDSQPTAARLGDSKINWPPAPAKLARFEGDVAVKELRHKLSLDPQLVPEPPFRLQRRRSGQTEEGGGRTGEAIQGLPAVTS